MPQRHLAPPLHLPSPPLLRLRFRIDLRIAVFTHVDEHLDDPVGLRFGAGGPVGEGGGRLRAVEVEEVWEGGHREPEVGEYACGPLL